MAASNCFPRVATDVCFFSCVLDSDSAAAAIGYHPLDGLEQHKFILSGLWKCEPASGGTMLSRGLWTASHPLPRQLPVAPLQPWALGSITPDPASVITSPHPLRDCAVSSLW